MKTNGSGCIANVYFPLEGCSCDYLNTRFELRKGDIVYVTGDFSGKIGVVRNVTEIGEGNYSKLDTVIARPDFSLHGTYIPVEDKFISFDETAVSPERFRSWVVAPGQNEKGAGAKTGYSISLDDFESDSRTALEALETAADYCRAGRVRYLSVRDGMGCAFVEDGSWYEITFRIEGDSVSELCCTCPAPNICKHELAALINLRLLLCDPDCGRGRNFTAIDTGMFFNAVKLGKREITL